MSSPVRGRLRLGLEADSVSARARNLHLERRRPGSDVVRDAEDYGPGRPDIPRRTATTGRVRLLLDELLQDAAREKPTVDARKMLTTRGCRRQVPHQLPGYGNDTYSTWSSWTMRRGEALEAAKARTLRFVYFIQHELGFRSLGLADDEYPTKDKLPLIPYHREGAAERSRAVHFTGHRTAVRLRTPLPHGRLGGRLPDRPPPQRNRRHLSTCGSCPCRRSPSPSRSHPGGWTASSWPTRRSPSATSPTARRAAARRPPDGQAAGTLAALAARLGREPRGVPVRDVHARCSRRGPSSFRTSTCRGAPAVRPHPARRRDGILKGKAWLTSGPTRPGSTRTSDHGATLAQGLRSSRRWKARPRTEGR